MLIFDLEFLLEHFLTDEHTCFVFHCGYAPVSVGVYDTTTDLLVGHLHSRPHGSTVSLCS